MSVTKIMRTRTLSGSAPITAKSRVTRSDSIKKRPIETSTKMITSAATSAIRNEPMKLVPPTISAIGLAINVKLIAAPPNATASTAAEMKNCTSDDEESTCTAWSVPFMISRYSSMKRSIERERSSRLLVIFSTRPSACRIERQCGSMRCSSLWRCADESRYAASASPCAFTSDP